MVKRFHGNRLRCFHVWFVSDRWQWVAPRFGRVCTGTLLVYNNGKGSKGGNIARSRTAERHSLRYFMIRLLWQVCACACVRISFIYNRPHYCTCSPTIECRSNTKQNIAYLNSPSSVVPNNDVADSQHKIQTYKIVSPIIIMWNSILT